MPPYFFKSVSLEELEAILPLATKSENKSGVQTIERPDCILMGFLKKETRNPVSISRFFAMVRMHRTKWRISNKNGTNFPTSPQFDFRAGTADAARVLPRLTNWNTTILSNRHDANFSVNVSCFSTLAMQGKRERFPAKNDFPAAIKEKLHQKRLLLKNLRQADPKNPELCYPAASILSENPQPESLRFSGGLVYYRKTSIRGEAFMGKLAFITGAGRGIGRAVAIRLARDGFDIAGTCLSNRDALEDTAKTIRAMGRDFLPLVYDVANAEESAKVLETAFRGVVPEVIVANAGIRRDNLFAFMNRGEWNDVLRTALDGFYNTVNPFVMDMMARKSGRIVVISSASGQAGQAGQVNYSAAKAALIGAVKALARETGRKNVTVNAVAPGFIETDMTEDLPKDKILPMIPLNRPGSPEDVAGAVSFLCGPDGAYIHGQVLAVNGGLVM